ncbi:MAG: glycosyltransferase [Candidatus Methanomethylicaceae archaeon]
MGEPLVSIIIPCYNGEKFVAEAIQSALDQTYPHKEVIVIDDGSTDRSLEVIKSFGSKIRWETGPNRGGSAARNRGIQIARGELIQFLDADDVLHPQKLERQVDVVCQNPESLVYCDYVVQDIETGEILEVPRRECAGQDSVCFAIMNERISISAPIYHKKWLEAVGGFDEELPCAQEYDLNIRLACHGYGWHHFREVLYTVRRRAGSVSSNYRRVLFYHGLIFQRALKIHEGRVGRDERVRLRIAAKLCSGARMLLRLGDRKTALSHFALAHTIHPSGGVPLAYSSSTRLLLRLLGPVATENLVMLYRDIRFGKRQQGVTRSQSLTGKGDAWNLALDRSK